MEEVCLRTIGALKMREGGTFSTIKAQMVCLVMYMQDALGLASIRVCPVFKKGKTEAMHSVKSKDW